MSTVTWREPILHVDMDSFFVEVERLENPGLRDRPVAVGGSGPRGVIASASYEARNFGVRSAQPTATARRLCPQLIVVAPAHGRYSDISADVFSVFRSFTPLVEGLSLDEAFLDVSGLRRHFDSSVAVGEEIRRQLRKELGLPASVGIASIKFVAKLASEAAKPDGTLLVTVEDQPAFLRSLPASAMWGVGPATLAALRRLGVESVGDISDLPEASLVRAVGPTVGQHLRELSMGNDPRPVVSDTKAKSISVEETYVEDLLGRQLVETALLAHAQRLSGRLRRSGLRARTLTLKMRFADFDTITRSHTDEVSFDGARHIFGVAKDLMALVDRHDPVRLVGLGAAGLEPTTRPSQLDLDAGLGWDRVEDAVADVRQRFGDGSVGPARLVSRSDSLEENQEPR